MSVLDTPEPLPEVQPIPPQAAIPNSVFDFEKGELGKVKRIVARHKLKDRIRFLQTVIKVHQPLIQAMKITGKAFQDGVQEGIRQVAAAEREREENLAKQGAQPAGVQETATPKSSGVVEHAGLPSASPELKKLLTP